MLNKEEESTKLTKEHIIKVFEDLFNKQTDKETPISDFGWKHNTWEDKGEKFSAWTFKTDKGSFTTGDGGKEAFDRIMKEEFSKLPNLTK